MQRITRVLNSVMFKNVQNTYSILIFKVRTHSWQWILNQHRFSAFWTVKIVYLDSEFTLYYDSIYEPESLTEVSLNDRKQKRSNSNPVFENISWCLTGTACHQKNFILHVFQDNLETSFFGLWNTAQFTSTMTVHFHSSLF